MTDQANGKGAAHNASVLVQSNVGDLEAALADAREREEEQAPRRRVEAAERAVAKAKQQLGWAEKALRQVIADNKAEAKARPAAIAEKATRRAAESEGN